MIYSGKAITVTALDNGIAELNFNLEGESVNKFNALTVNELKQAGEALASAEGVTGLIVTSSKDVFIVGADITEFGDNFSNDEEAIAAATLETNKTVFNPIEDLPFPTVTAINGFALGGGLEMAMTTDYRVMSTAAKIGLPETKLGIIPGFGGTVRLPRLIGADNAVEWIAAGKEQKPEAALTAGAVDAVVAPEQLRDAALDLVQKCIDGEFDYKAKRQEKLDPLKLNDIEAMMSFETAKAFVGGQAGPNYPAPVTAVKVIQKAAKLGRDDALAEEAKGIAKLAKTEVARNLVGLFLGDQELAKTGKTWAKKGGKVERGAVLGAGIMGGGIAYQSALKGTPIIMKDIAQAGIDLGLSEASKLLSKRVSRGRMTPEKMAAILSNIQPQLGFDGFDTPDVIVEAVVENPKVKHAVLAETEKQIREDAILASNTSTISITYLAEALQRPQNFCGMHFFNPVHQMPLVEVIRGEKTSDEAVARTVAYALAMGKKPVVVNDCPGFLVNRILSPYFGGFMRLVKDGADFTKIDKVMEKFGMPMGPAYLADVVGIDTGVHAGEVMAEGFPTRMGRDFKTSHEVLFENDRYGQKNGKGYYSYEVDRKGKPKKVVDESVVALLAPVVDGANDFSDEEILDRMMIPMCLEAVRCLEEGIAASAVDVDMSLIYGIGFPPFRGGALHYIQDMGIAEFVARADKYTELGESYQVTEKLREMAANGEVFFA
ncbi:fatty acid oxidation complex subunit alpha FadB [Pseudomaricurvus alkylphenolicus]|uniref:fatty acid oxidation complex subunit alpha FadB n=1 Tax=Pseudomaricurvus alkylphenolicus TaxID=1306991 RepID=UPI0014219B40|nr:fatty acid oxidation complex subunit alpha FadB [Pseudomaricurvus alkylphenolicus]NIB39914.1 fatty acid oxidation complex subunit alpha FadB [Pseudomaricurvus alkylphenolicus]